MARSARFQDQRIILASHLHATLLNQIAALVAQSQVCESAVASGDAQFFAEVSRLRDMLRALEESTRDLIDVALDPNGMTLADALQTEIEEFLRRHPEIRVDSSIDGVSSIRAKWLTRLVVDVIHEALINAAKHGRPSQMQVVAARVADGLLVRIRDNGRGFDARICDGSQANPSGHYGIYIMQEGAKSAQGRLEITSAPGKGTQVTLFVPVANARMVRLGNAVDLEKRNEGR